MRVAFVTHPEDPLAAAVPRLEAGGIKIDVINGEPPPRHAIALFTLSEDASRSVPGRHIRLGVTRLGDPPEWVRDMPFKIGVQPRSLQDVVQGSSQPGSRGNLFEALHGAHDVYATWRPEPDDDLTPPWETGGSNTVSEETVEARASWSEQIQAVVDHEKLREDGFKGRVLNIPVSIRNVGEWQVQFAENNPVHIDADVRAQIEWLLERYVDVAMPMYLDDYPVPNLSMERMGVPAPVVRLDMPPATNGLRGICEVESNVSGLGLAGLLGVSVAEPIARCLRHYDMNDIAFGAFGSRKVQGPELQIFMRQMRNQGVHVAWIDDLKASEGRPLWLRVGHEDLDLVQDYMGQALLCHYHGGGHKRYLLDLDDAVTLRDIGPNLRSILNRYPEGFALKPVGGWGTREVHILCLQGDAKSFSMTYDRMESELLRIFREGDEANWLVQVFRPPEVIRRDLPQGGQTKECRIWRCYAVWNGTRYELTGGFWAQRKSLMVHGASDCIMGPLHV